MKELYRKILSAAIFQHSSKVQPFKQSSLDRIIERIIFLSENDCLTIEEIQENFISLIGYNIPVSIFESATERLLKLNSIEICDDDKYKLSAKKEADLVLIEGIAIKREKQVVEKVFKNAPNGSAKLQEPFWYSLTFIFSNIGEYSAKLVSGTIDIETVLFPLLDSCINKIKEKFDIDYEYFAKRLIHFFSELEEPVYNETKCILAQNHFIAKTIGISPDSATFSEELFKNKVFYLDTNVLLAIVSENNRKHNNAVSFIKAASKLGLHFCVANITVQEYENWIVGEFERIRKTRNQIPQKTKWKIASPAYQDYYKKFQELSLENDTLDSEEVLSEIEKRYFNFKEILSSFIDEERLEYVDDLWFDNIEKDKDFEYFVKIVKEKYSEVSNIREKGANAAVHDAKILLWLEKLSKDNPDKFLFVSTDTSLPLIKFNVEGKSKNINLEAVLQWIIPLTNSHVEKDIDHVIAEILKQKILPREFMFEIKDFLIFDQLQMECKELPHEDVENCILHLKSNMSELNPNSAEDREKFASEIAKYFIDPTRKYQKELSDRERENEELKTKLGDVFVIIENLQKQSEQKDIELDETKSKHKEKIEKLSKKHNKQIAEVNQTLATLTSQLDIIKQDKIDNETKTLLSKWKKPGKIALIAFVLLILFGILELIPDWGWNFPAKVLAKINSFTATNQGMFNLAIGINLLLLGVIVTLFVFSYNRLFNKEKIEDKTDSIKNKLEKQ